MAAGPDDVAAGLGDHAHARGQLRQRRAQRRAEAADVLHRLRVVDGKAAADVERVERAEPLAARRGQQPRARLDGLDVLGGIGGLRADVEGQPAHVDAELAPPAAPAPARPPDRSRTCATGRTPRPGLRNETRSSSCAALAVGARTCAPRRGCRRRRCARRIRSALRMSCGALDRVACGCSARARHPRRCTSCTSPVVARSSQPPSLDHRPHHRRVRQRLQRVVQIDPRQRAAAACGTARAPARSRGSAAASRTRCTSRRISAGWNGSMNRGAAAPARSRYGSTAMVPLPSSLSRDAGRPRAAAGRGPRPSARRRAPSCTRMRWQPALSSVRRLRVQIVRDSSPGARPALIQVTYLWERSGSRCASTATRRPPAESARRPARRSRPPARWSCGVVGA